MSDFLEILLFVVGIILETIVFAISAIIAFISVGILSGTGIAFATYAFLKVYSWLI